MACPLVCSKYIKKCMAISKILDIVNLYQLISMLKLKIIVNLPQLCIVVSAALNGDLSDLVGLVFTVTVDDTTRYKKETTANV